MPEPYDTSALTDDAASQEPNDEGQDTQQPDAGQSSQEPELMAPEGWDSQQYPLKFHEETLYPENYQHAIKLMQQGVSYDRRMEELNRQRAEMQQSQQKLAQYQRLEEAFSRNPQFASQIWDLYNRVNSGQQPQGGQPSPQQQGAQSSPEYQQLMQKISEYDSKFQQWEQQQEDADVDKEVNGLKAKYPQAPWDTPGKSGHTFLYEVLSHAAKHNFHTLEAAYRDFTYDKVAANQKAEGARAVAKTRQANAKRGVVAQGAPKAGGKEGEEATARGLSYDDAARMVAEKMGLQT